jgi:hypothetical protein
MFSKWLTHFALFSTIEIVGMRLENTWLFCLPQGRLGNEWSLLPGQRTDGCDGCETPRTIPQRYIRWKMQSKLLATAHQVEGQWGLGDGVAMLARNREVTGCQARANTEEGMGYHSSSNTVR